MSVHWKVSLHGGHSSDYCDHAFSPLREMLDAAVAYGYETFGVSEHCPRAGEAFLYPTELELGWTVETLYEKFDQYARDMTAIQQEYEGRLRVLRGFETEVVPEDRYIEIMLGLREKYAFEYMVGSVHHIQGSMIDFDQSTFLQVADQLGGVENLAVRYYEQVGEMVSALQPEVVGHFDLIRKCAPDEASVTTPAVKRTAFKVLEVIKEAGSILDINTAAYRKGLGRPYVAPWLLDAALQLGIPMCFGDDSHCVADVGAGIDDARQYLLQHGITAIHCIGETEPRSLLD